MSNIQLTASSLQLFIPQNLIYFGLSLLLYFVNINADDRAVLCIAKTPLETPFFTFYEENNTTCFGCLFQSIIRNGSSLQEKDQKYESIEVIETSSDSVELIINSDDSNINESTDLSTVIVLVNKRYYPTIFTVFHSKEFNKSKIIFVVCENVTVITDYKVLNWPELNSENVLSQSMEKFGFITSYTDATYSNKIILSTNQGNIQSFLHKCDKQIKNHSPVATCSVLLKQVISGCYYQNRIAQTDNDVHVIDINHNDYDSKHLLIFINGMDAFINTQSTGTSVLHSNKILLKRNITLVFCSRQPISLAVHVKNLEGVITFLVGGNDQVENISPSESNVTISVKKVELPKSFDMLLIYVLSNVGLPISYIKSSSSSVIKMIVPSTAVAEIESIDKQVKKSIVVKCMNDNVHVSIPRFVAESLRMTAMSFSDPSCFSKINDSHLFLTSKFNSCGFYTLSRGEYTIYSNVIYVDIGKYSLFESDDEDFEEGSGFSPHFPTHSSQIHMSVECKFKDHYNSNEASEGYNYKMFLYKDENYLIKLQDSEFPLKIPASSFIHVEIKRTDDSNFNLRLLVEECWLSSSPQFTVNAETLIRKSCPIHPFVTIHNTHNSQTVRFKFKLSKHTSKTQYLLCEIGLCSNNALPKPEIVKCVDPSSYCGKSSLLTVFANQFFLSKRKNLVIGPLIAENFTIQKELPKVIHSHGFGQFKDGKTFFSTKHQPSIIVVDGLSTEAVVGIAILSFLLGIGLMGTLWLIYNKTDPARQRRPESNVSMGLNYDIDPNSGSSTPSSELPMTA